MADCDQAFGDGSEQSTSPCAIIGNGNETKQTVIVRLVRFMIALNIRRYRKHYKFTQEDIAERIGVSRQAVAKWESGESVPDINSCLALADLFGISLDELAKSKDDADTDMKPSKGRHIFGMVKVGDRGQIVIPKRAREIFNIFPGSSLLILGDESQGLAIVKGDQFLNFAQAIIAVKEKSDDGEV